MKLSINLFFLAASVVMIGFRAGAQAWPEINRWNGMETEIEYSSWFKNNVTTDFYFKKTGLLAGKVPVDCGKAAYVARAVFAFETGRRFLAMGRDLKWIDSNTGNFKGNSSEERLRDFLRTQIVARTNVESMKYNTFPIQIERNSLTAGTVFNFQMPGFEENEAGRHAYIVKEITDGGYIKFIWSTVPVAPRVMSERTLFPVYMPTDVSINNQWGFRRFYQPDDYLTGKVIDLKKQLIRSSNNESLEVEDKLKRLLYLRHYNSTYQNELSKEVMAEYEAEKESKQYMRPRVSKIKSIATPKILSKTASLNFQTLFSSFSIIQQANERIVAAPGYRRYTIADAMQDKRSPISPLHSSPSIVDQMISEAQQHYKNEEIKKFESIKIKRNISFPDLVKNGTFVTDPDSIVEGLSVINIFHSKLVSLLQTEEETLEQSLERQYFNLCTYLEDRVAAVDEGYQYFFVDKKIVSKPNEFNRCPSEEELYNYTTPNRDSEFKDYVTNLLGFYRENRNQVAASLPYWSLVMDYSLYYDLDRMYLVSGSAKHQQLIDAFEKTRKFLPQGQGQFCRVDLDLKNRKVKSLSIRDFIPILLSSYNFKTKEGASVKVPLFSSYPYVGMARRWGLEGLTQDIFEKETNINCTMVSKTEAENAANPSSK